MADIKKLKQDRFSFLKKVYDTVEGQKGYLVDGFEIGKELGFDREYTKSIFSYLNDEGLIEPMGAGIRLTIAHNGIKEVEELLSEPSKSTEHFLPLNQYNTISIHNMSGGAIQQATSNSKINYTTSNEVLKGIAEFTDELKKFISRENLPNDEVEELKTDIETIEVQNKSRKPKTEILKTSLNSIKSIMERVVAGVTTKFIISNSKAIITKANHLIQILQNSIPD